MIPIDPSGTQRHMMLVQREFATIANAKQQVEKPQLSLSAERSFGKLDPQAMRNPPSADGPADAEVRRFMCPRPEAADEHTATVEHPQLPARGPEAEAMLDHMMRDPAVEGTNALDRFFDFGVKAGGMAGHNGFEFLRDKAAGELHATMHATESRISGGFSMEARAD